jgi:hypothetical protein
LAIVIYGYYSAAIPGNETVKALPFRSKGKNWLPRTFLIFVLALDVKILDSPLFNVLASLVA